METIPNEILVIILHESVTFQLVEKYTRLWSPILMLVCKRWHEILKGLQTVKYTAILEDRIKKIKTPGQIEEIITLLRLNRKYSEFVSYSHILGEQVNQALTDKKVELTSTDLYKRAINAAEACTINSGERSCLMKIAEELEFRESNGTDDVFLVRNILIFRRKDRRETELIILRKNRTDVRVLIKEDFRYKPSLGSSDFELVFGNIRSKKLAHFIDLL